MNLTRFRSSFLRRSLSILILLVFISTAVCPPAAYAQLNGQASLGLSLPASILAPSEAFLPTVIKGLRVDPQNPLQFNFIVDTGDTGIKDEALKNESTKLIKYFLAALTTPDKDMWVNLSPTEKDRIIPEGLGSTEMGRDLLSQDYLLKQLTASLMYPESELGDRFWKNIYGRVKEQYGTTELPVNMLNKVWIVPDKALVCEHEEAAFVVEKHLKVMMEEEYLNSGTRYEVRGTEEKERSTYHLPRTTEIIKQILIPAIEHEVNTGRNFAQLRQIYNSMILATWYKRRLKESLLGQLYVDKNKTKGIDLQDKEAKYKIYNQYLEAFRKGAYDYIKEDYDPVAQEVVTRKYVSGGMAYDPAMVAIVTPEQLDQAQRAEMSVEDGKTWNVGGVYVENKENSDAASLTEEQEAKAASDENVRREVLKDEFYQRIKPAEDVYINAIVHQESIGVAKKFNLVSDTATKLVTIALMKPLQDRLNIYKNILLLQINPDSRDLKVYYPGAGFDFVGVLAATDGTEFHFVDKNPVNLDSGVSNEKIIYDQIKAIVKESEIEYIPSQGSDMDSAIFYFPLAGVDGRIRQRTVWLWNVDVSKGMPGLIQNGYDVFFSADPFPELFNKLSRLNVGGKAVMYLPLATTDLQQQFVDQLKEGVGQFRLRSFSQTDYMINIKSSILLLDKIGPPGDVGDKVDGAMLSADESTAKERDMRKFEEKIVRTKNLSMAFQAFSLIDLGIYGRTMKGESSPVIQLFIDLERQLKLSIEEIGGATPKAKYVLKDFGQKEGVHSIFMWRKLVYAKMIKIPHAVAAITEGSESAWLREFDKDTFFKDITVGADGRYEVDQFVDKVMMLANKLSSSGLFQKASNPELWDKIKKVQDTIQGTWEEYNVPDILTREHVILREDLEKEKAADTDAASLIELKEDEKKIAESLQILQNTATDVEKVINAHDIRGLMDRINTWYDQVAANAIEKISTLTDVEAKNQAYTDLRQSLLAAFKEEDVTNISSVNKAVIEIISISQEQEVHYFDEGQLKETKKALLVTDVSDKFIKITQYIRNILSSERRSLLRNNPADEFLINDIQQMKKETTRFDQYLKFLQDIQHPKSITLRLEDVGPEAERSEADGFPEWTYSNFLIPLQQNHPDLLKLAQQGKEVKGLSGVLRHELGNVINGFIGQLSLEKEWRDIHDEYFDGGLNDLWLKFTQKNESDSDVEMGENFNLFKDEVSKWSERVYPRLDPEFLYSPSIKRSLEFFNLFLSRNFDQEMRYEASTLSDLINDAKCLLSYYSYSDNGLFSQMNKKIFFKTEFEPAVDKQSVDKLRLLQVFMNLFKNAVEAMPEGGTLTVKTEAVGDGQNFRITVTDTGKGIAPEDFHKVFDMNFTTKEKEGGSGIGAALNKQYIDAMGGTIKVESEVGKGSTFTIELPVRRGADEENQSGDAAMNSFSNPPKLAKERDQEIEDYTIILGDIVQFAAQKNDPPLSFLDSEQRIAEVAQKIVKTNNPMSVLFGSLNLADQRRLFTYFFMLLIRKGVDHKETNQARRNQIVESLLKKFPDAVIPKRGSDWDKASLSTDELTSTGAAPGGIDFNSELLDLQIKRDGNGVPLPLPQQPIENMRIDGFFPVITTITPVTNVPALSGMLVKEN